MMIHFYQTVPVFFQREYRTVVWLHESPQSPPFYTKKEAKPLRIASFIR